MSDCDGDLEDCVRDLSMFLSIQSVIVYYLRLIFRVNGSQHWWAFAFLAACHCTYYVIDIVCFLLGW